jgi:hypothetical protein
MRQSVVGIKVANIGQTEKPVTVILDRPASLLLGNSRASCRLTVDGTDCSSRLALAPGERLDLLIALEHQSQQNEAITVRAELGTAKACWGQVCANPQNARPSTAPGTTFPALPASLTSPAPPAKEPEADETMLSHPLIGITLLPV